jgi:nucleoside-diphosphate-sugar epimerase
MKTKLLVTGSDGFIGRNLIHKLKLLESYDLKSFDLKDGDILDPGLSLPEGIGHIIHLAARTYIPDSWENPAAFYQTNVQGTIRVLDYCRKNGSSLSYISAYVYGRPESLPISEDHPLSPLNPYMHSKVMAEEVCRFYHENYGVNVTVLRPFNIMGAGQRDDFLIPHLVKQILDPESEQVRVKDLDPKRDYIHMDDLLDAILSSLNAVKAYEVYNVGSGESFSVRQIIEILMEISGKRKEIVSEKQERQNEVSDVRADIRKIKAGLNWEPRISFKEGLRMIINAYNQDAL